MNNSTNITGTSFALEMSGTQNLNKFFNIIQFFSKIGKYLILEVDTETVIMRTLNDAKSAFASVEFDKEEFFNNFELKEDDSQELGQIFACKLLIRPLVVILRKAKKMHSLRMFNDVNTEGEHELTFVISCEYGIRRRHRFIYQACDIVSAMFDDEVCNRLRVMPKVLTQLFAHTKSLEVAVDVSTKQFKMKSFHQQNSSEPTSLAARQQKLHMMTSEMCVDPDEFDLYEFRFSNEPQELAFCCKELRAILWLCEASDIPDLTFLFTEGGSPVKFACEDCAITCQLVMATLEPRGTRDTEQQPQQQQQQRQAQGQQQQLPPHYQSGQTRAPGQGRGMDGGEEREEREESGVYEDENDRRNRLRQAGARATGATTGASMSTSSVYTGHEEESGSETEGEGEGEGGEREGGETTEDDHGRRHMAQHQKRRRLFRMIMDDDDEGE